MFHFVYISSPWYASHYLLDIFLHFGSFTIICEEVCLLWSSALSGLFKAHVLLMPFILQSCQCQTAYRVVGYMVYMVVVVTSSRYNPGIFLKGLRKAMKRVRTGSVLIQIWTRHFLINKLINHKQVCHMFRCHPGYGYCKCRLFECLAMKLYEKLEINIFKQ